MDLGSRNVNNFVIVLEAGVVLERGVVLAVRSPNSQLVPTLCLLAALFWFPYPKKQAPLEVLHTRLGKVLSLWVSVLLFLQTCKVEESFNPLPVFDAFVVMVLI